MKFFEQKVFLIAAAIVALLTAVIYIQLLIPGSSSEITQESSVRAMVFFIGLILGAVVVCLTMLGLLTGETKRFDTQMKNSRRSDRVRPPFSPYSITKQEFLSMWGDDNPDTFRPEGK